MRTLSGCWRAFCTRFALPKLTCASSQLAVGRGVLAAPEYRRPRCGHSSATAAPASRRSSLKRSQTRHQRVFLCATRIVDEHGAIHTFEHEQAAGRGTDDTETLDETLDVLQRARAAERRDRHGNGRKPVRDER